MDCNKETEYFCSKSRQCIKKEWLCDGAVQCIMGEDESLELCIGLEEQFPEKDTFPCFSSEYRHYDVTIYATPCDGIVECQNEADEKFCDTIEITKEVVKLVIIIVILIFWISIFVVAKKNNVWVGLGWKYQNDSREGTSYGLRGNALARLKVSMY